MSCRIADGFFNIRICGNEEPEITTLVLNHGKSFFDFDFAEESDATKRLFDLVDMLLTSREGNLQVETEWWRYQSCPGRFRTFFCSTVANMEMKSLWILILCNRKRRNGIC